jgi:molybdopterin converting factor small subunit
MSVEVVLPGVLADLTGGSRHVEVDPGGGTVADLLDTLGSVHPRLVRRIRDEAGALRRFVNVYVDGDDVRFAGGLGAPVPDGAVVQVLPSVAGG